MLEAIVAEHKIGSLFWQLPLCFFDRNEEPLELENAFCVPYTETHSGSITGTNPHIHHQHSTM